MNLLIALLLSTFLAGIVQGISGFAFAIIFLAVMQYFIPYGELLALSALLAIVMLTVNVIVYRQYIQWRQLPIPLLINFVVTIGAIQFLKGALEFPYWHKLLGVVFILLSLYLYFWQQKICIRPTFGNALLLSSAGGILGGLFGVGGPPLVLYYLATTDSKEKYLGTTQMFFLFNMLYDFGGRFISGMVTTEVFQYGMMAVGTTLLGLWIGRRIFRLINADTLKKIVYVIMFMDGWYMLLLG